MVLRTLAGPVLGALLLASSPAEAAPRDDLPTASVGGRVSARRHGYTMIGFPDLEGGVRFPVRNADLSARLRLGFGIPSFSSVPNAVSLGFGSDLRWQVFDTGDIVGVVIGSVQIGPGLGAGRRPTVGLGLLSPGFLFVYRIVDLVDLSLGLQLQLDLWISPALRDDTADGLRSVVLYGGLPIVIAGDIRVRRGISLGVRVEAGPLVAVGEGPLYEDVAPVAQVGGRIRAALGVSVDF